MLLTNVRSTEDWKTHRIYVNEGLVDCMDCKGRKDGEVIDCENRLMTPPLVNSHVHLTIWSTKGKPNESGTLIEGNEIYLDVLKKMNSDDLKERVLRALKIMFSRGIMYVRSHDPPISLLSVILEARKLSPVVLQEVVFPTPGSINEDTSAVEKFLAKGAEVLGGIPHAESTTEEGIKSIRTVFEIASRYNKLVDLHIDETDDPDSRFSAYAVKEAIKRNMCESLTLSHITASHSYPGEYWRHMRKCGSVVINPITNAFLQGRYDNYPKRRGIARVKELMRDGINVSIGTDNVMDSVFPLGDFNVFRAAYQLSFWDSLDINEVLQTITFNGARTLGIKNYGYPRKGKNAEMVVLNCKELSRCDPSLLPFLVIKGRNLSVQGDSSIHLTD
ncbi:amidohydrolase family protein [Sulfuracidifex tepidarius]|uniref:5'-deoxyadenosine deaminase n=1 Tax=Sulfuracidifex tepidarius TaxID=1294262 RepID=A0A510E5K4_9CREN|nr:amidohydrolase family protein [Sulfuracidifex tepidarius]BBG27784.1 5'-deoxyadenosine deaminase [Sulfuracidifex tepidarius]